MKKLSLYIFLILGISINSCSDDETPNIDNLPDEIENSESSSNDINSFSINDINGVFTENSITISFLVGTDVSNLTPSIEHTGVSIFPDTNIAQDFSTPIVYSVTAENGEVQDWTVTVEFTYEPSAGSEFITTWQTSEIIIPTHPDYTYNYNVDWDNDGIIDESEITSSVQHNYEKEGIYTIRISGDFPAIYFNNSDESDQIISLDQWGTGIWLSMESAFNGCSNLLTPAQDTPNFSEVTSMKDMFRYAVLVDPKTDDWDTSNVTTMNSMFLGASTANPNTSMWNTSKVTTMEGMFLQTRKANPDTSNWDTSNVTSTAGMFFDTDIANPDTSNWDTSNITNIDVMFFDAMVANPDTSNWNTQNVISFAKMFTFAYEANPDVSNWDTSNVINMSSMFSYAKIANPDVSNWNISKVTNMRNIFQNSSFSSENYEKLLISFANQSRQANVNFHAGSATYCSDLAQEAREKLIEDSNWVITDSGQCID